MADTQKIKKHNMFNAKRLGGKMVKHQNKMDKAMESLFGKQDKSTKAKAKKKTLKNLLGF